MINDQDDLTPITDEAGLSGIVAPLIDDLREVTEQTVHDQMGRAANAANGIAEALREAAGRLEERQIKGLARYAERAADGVSGWSNSIRDARIGDLVAEAEKLARWQPEWVLAGAAAAGFLVGRLIRASEQRHESETEIERAGSEAVNALRSPEVHPTGMA